MAQKRIRAAIEPNVKIRKVKFDRKKSNTISVPSKPTDYMVESKPSLRKRLRIEEEMLRACISEGMHRNEMKKILNVDENGLASIEKRLLAKDGQQFLNMSTAYRYYIYALQQEQCARDLEELENMFFEEMDVWHKAYMENMNKNPYAMKDYPSRPSTQTAVMILKAKSELLDKTMKMGQDMGIVEKRAKEIRVSGNVNLAAMSTTSLRSMLQQKLEEFNNLVSKGALPTAYRNMLKSKQNDPFTK